MSPTKRTSRRPLGSDIMATCKPWAVVAHLLPTPTDPAPDAGMVAVLVSADARIAGYIARLIPAHQSLLLAELRALGAHSTPDPREALGVLRELSAEDPCGLHRDAVERIGARQDAPALAAAALEVLLSANRVQQAALSVLRAALRYQEHGERGGSAPELCGSSD